MWYNSVIRGDLNPIYIGHHTCIGDNTVIHTVAAVGTGTSAAVDIADNVIIGSHCSLCSCTIADECYISPGCTILEGARLEKGCMLAPGSVVPPGRLIPAGQVWGGNPVEYIRTINYAEEFANYAFTYSHADLAETHKIAYCYTPNAYLLKATTKEDIEIAPEIAGYYSGIDTEQLRNLEQP